MLLKVEIHRDIFKDYKLSVSKREVRKFLHRYVNSKTYQALHIENAVRHDLMGEESGVVTKENLDLMVERKEERKKMISTEKVEIGEVKKDKADKFNQKKYNKSSLSQTVKESTKGKSKMESHHINKPKLGLNIR